MKNMDNSRSSLWAWVPVGLLGAMFAGLGTLTYIALDDPHFALEPDYYEKAVHWDRAQALARESAATGINAEVGPLVRSADGSVELQLRLLDRDAKPVVGASVSLEAFPNAFANQVERPALREVAPGVYAGRLSRAVLGVWELRLNATLGALQFRQVLRQDVTKGDAA
jgi:hypothetical protein